MDSSLHSFFTRSAESAIDFSMMRLDYVFPYDEVRKYVSELLARPLSAYVDWIRATRDFNLTLEDIPQFSKLEDGVVRICNVLRDANNPGLDFVQMGSGLLNDGKERKIGALRKYGENHGKLGVSLGLLQSMDHVYFLGCLGEIIDRLNPEEQSMLLTRLILRSKLFQYFMIKTQHVYVNVYLLLHDELGFSDSTYGRRLSNIKKMMRMLLESHEYDFTFLKRKLFMPSLKQLEQMNRVVEIVRNYPAKIRKKRKIAEALSTSD